MEKRKKIPISLGIDDIGIDLLESITKGTYEDPVYVIREYVQNSFDANAKKISIVLRTKSDDSLEIIDNGLGMDKNETIDLKKIGVGIKPPEKVGFRGIGFWSGLAISKYIEVSTIKKDKKKRYVFQIDSEGIKKEFHTGKTIKEVLEKNVKLFEEPTTKDHGTEITLKLTEGAIEKLRNEEYVKGLLELTLPVKFHRDAPHKEKITKFLEDNDSNYRCCKIVFQGNILHSPLVKDLDDPIFYNLVDDKGNEYGHMWICIHKKTSAIKNKNAAGIIFKIKNFSIGKRENWSTLWPERKITYPMITGDIHVTHPDIWPDISRTRFEFSPSREELFKLVKIHLQDINSRLGKISKKKSDERKSKTQIKRLDSIKSELSNLSKIEKFQKYSELEQIKTDLKKRRPQDPTLRIKRDQALEEIPQIQDTLILEKREAEKILKEVEKTKSKKKKKKEEKVDENCREIILEILENPKLSKESKPAFKTVLKILEEEIESSSLINILRKIKESI